MVKGGYRKGAGRKRGVPNLLTQKLRAKIRADRLIKFLQDLAEGRIEKASISERKEAAIALLKKVLPDCKTIEIGQNSEIENYRQKERERVTEVDNLMNRISPAAREELYDAVEAIEEERKSSSVDKDNSVNI